MPRTKVHSQKRKKRRFTGKQYMKKSSSATTESKESIKKSDKSSGDKDDVGRGVKHESVKSLPASVRKLKPQLDDSSEESTENEGFRLVNISVLAMVFEYLPCPSCKRGVLSLEEDEASKMGLASLLVLKCTGGNCLFTCQFYTSDKIRNKQAFNRRAVLAMRNIGVGHQGPVKFTCIMNMLPPMNDNAYRDHVKALRDASEIVAKESKAKEANDMKELYEPSEKDLYDIAEVESTLNSRPLAYEYNEVEEEVLTPSHLIYGR